MEAAGGVTDRVRGKCSVAGCHAPVDRCIEDLSPEDCPNFTLGPEIEVVPTDGGQALEPEMVVRVSRGGLALSTDDADDCMLSAPLGRRAAVIALVGVPDCGKTTLLASLYEIVRRNLSRSVSFAGSETIQGFEERCHLSRLTSNNDSPDTPRTARDLQFLHMSVIERGRDERVDLFMADRRGEQFQEVLNRPSLSGSLIEIQRGDTVAFLLDGDHLVDSGRRESAISKVYRLGMALKPGLREAAAIQLVVTKHDKIQGCPDEAHVKNRVQSLSTMLSGLFGAGVQYSLHYVAARDLESDSNGMHELLSGWLREIKSRKIASVVLPKGSNTFERLMNLRCAGT